MSDWYSMAGGYVCRAEAVADHAAKTAQSRRAVLFIRASFALQVSLRGADGCDC
jgi:hypothetical protein